MTAGPGGHWWLPSPACAPGRSQAPWQPGWDTTLFCAGDTKSRDFADHGGLCGHCPCGNGWAWPCIKETIHQTGSALGSVAGPALTASFQLGFLARSPECPPVAAVVRELGGTQCCARA